METVWVSYLTSTEDAIPSIFICTTRDLAILKMFEHCFCYGEHYVESPRQPVKYEEETYKSFVEDRKIQNPYPWSEIKDYPKLMENFMRYAINEPEDNLSYFGIYSDTIYDS